MKKFIQFECHEYMDEYPFTETRSMEESDAASFAEHMNKNYSGGTTRLKKVLTKEEASQYVINTIREVIHNTGENPISSDDWDFIKYLIKEFDSCYKNYDNRTN